MQQIITNKIKCKKCGDVIESKYTHDFKMCKCGAVGVDGGHAYLRRQGNPDDWEELSEVLKLRLTNAVSTSSNHTMPERAACMYTSTETFSATPKLKST